MSTINATNIVADALVGNTSANAITVRGEGSATTSLQQGLAKCFIRISQPGSVTDSFNSSSSTDVSTGQHRNGYTNNMAGAANACTSIGCNGAVNTNTLLVEVTQNESASQNETLCLLLSGTSSHAYIDGAVTLTVHGDLA
tara:strand:- start:907 stop:1329 length:423 start_codon:yes stop_codon:yes gene_type:complete